MNQKFPDTATGTLKVHPRGFGFLQPDDRNSFPEDIFIPKHATKGAVDGDIVEATVQDSPKGPEGRITKIIKRGRQHVAGTVVFKNKKGAFAYIPLIGEDKLMRLIPSQEREMEAGDRLIIRVLEWGSDKRESVGEMSSYLGQISDPSCDTACAIEEFEIDHEFSKQILNEAKDWGTTLSAKDLEGREDLRELDCITIDPDTAKDFDDALSLSQNEKGEFCLGVHIADVSYYVRPGSELDKAAKERCNSVYFPGFVVPMLPHELSSHLCSLKPNLNRLTISVFMTFDQEGTLLEYRMARSVIKSKKRFTYREAKEVLDGTKKSKFKKDLFLMVDLCHRLKKKRSERGSIEFALPDTEVHVDENGVATKIEIVEYDITHQLVEEFMLKANEVVATFLASQNKPLTYRVHEEPNPENMKEFSLIARALGFKISESPTSEELQNLFDEARESPFGRFLAVSFIRSLKLAAYSTQNIGHFGLGLTYYTHFTSPIRRYIDLVVHRVLLNEIDPKENLEDIALQCSEKERLSSKAENSVLALKKLRLIESLQKEDPKRTYEAVITSVKPFGFVFTLVDFLFDGFLPVSMIQRSEYFVFDEKNRRLKSKNLSFRTGDRIQVMLKSVNLITQHTEWALPFTLKHKSKGKHRKRK